MFEYKVDDMLVYATFSGSQRTVRITGKYDDVKNGRPGFDGYLVSDPDFGVWGYDDQIVRVIR